MHKTRRSRHREIGGEGTQQDQVDLARIDAGLINTPSGGLDGHVAGGNIRFGVTPFLDARPLQDPFGVVAQFGQILVVNCVLRRVTADAHHLNAHQLADPGSLGLEFDVAGPPLGVDDKFRYQSYVTKIPPGSRLLVYTDGLVEAFSAADEMFGADRLPSGVSLVPLSIPSAGADPIVEEALRSGRFPYLPDLVSVNRSYVQDDAVRLGEVLDLLSAPANLPAVVHCLGGKDRTGVTTALLLTILGVPWSTVREDYLRSNAYYEGTVGGRPSSLSLAMEERLGHAPDFGDEETKREFFVLQPAYIDVVLSEMTKDSRSIAEFVATELRLSDDTVQSLRSELLHRSESHPAGPHMAASIVDSGDRET